MTLLEGVIALVVLGLSAVGFLDVFRSGADAATRAASWTELVQEAEAAMESASSGVPLEVVTRSDMRREVSTRPWRPGLDEILVEVRSPDGARFEVRRLVRSPRATGPQP